MANAALTISTPADPDLDGPEDMASDIQDATSTRTDEVGPAALSLAVDDEDLGAEERFDEYGDWQDDYADAVGISRWREL